MQYEKVKNAQTTMSSEYSNLETVINQRSKLTTKLSEICEKYMIDRNNLIKELALSRKNIDKAKNINQLSDSNSKMDRILKMIYEVSIYYTNLTSDMSYEGIKHELNEANKRIEDAIKDYNSSISEYNKLLNAFPTSLIKIIAKYKEKTYFENK